MERPASGHLREAPPGAPDAGAARSGVRHGGALWLWVPVVLYCALIFVLSSVSDVPSLPGDMSDKTGHGLLYLGLGFLVARALAGGLGQPLRLGMVAVSIVLSTVYGLSDECHQWFVPSREFDLRDLTADAVGASIGAGVSWLCGIIGPVLRRARRVPPRKP